MAEENQTNNSSQNSTVKKFFVTIILLLAIAVSVYIIVTGDSTSLYTLGEVTESETLSTEIPTFQTETETESETETVSLLETITNTSSIPSSYEIAVDSILQNPELPTGCEITSLTMVLNYWGYDIDKCSLADEYLPQETNGGVCGFDTAFIGSPYDSSSFGCFAPVITSTAIDYIADQNKKMNVSDISGSSMEELYAAISNGYPIVVWATMSLHEPAWTYYWSLEDGTDVYFPTYEHCLVLDKEQGVVYVDDPLKGEYTYDIELFEQRYEEMNSQAVILY